MHSKADEEGLIQEAQMINGAMELGGYIVIMDYNGTDSGRIWVIRREEYEFGLSGYRDC